MLFGLLMAITMVATTIGALLVLPAAIKLTKIRLVQYNDLDKEPAYSRIKTFIPIFAKKS